jgi:hypothetical protein
MFFSFGIHFQITEFYDLASDEGKDLKARRILEFESCGPQGLVNIFLFNTPQDACYLPSYGVIYNYP